MTWLTANWFWILVFVAFIAMHKFGHGGHGGGGHRVGMDMKEDDEAQKGIVNKSSSGHRHWTKFGLAIFEGTIALYAQARFKYGRIEVGAIFVVCGLVMAVFQVGAVAFLAGRIRELYQIGASLGLMGISLGLMVIVREAPLLFGLVGLLALGMSLVSPNLASLISKGGGSRSLGVALGAQNAANSFGQASGPLLGGALFAWKMNAPYLLTGALLATVALIIGWKTMVSKHKATLA